MKTLAVIVALFAAACSAPYVEYAPNGDLSYQTATLCASAEAAPVLRDAVARWHAAAPQVRTTVRVVADAEAVAEGCATNVYFADLGRVCDGVDVEHCAAMGGGGVIVIDSGLQGDADLTDIVAHELGHLLTGDAHSADEASVMFWRTMPDEGTITAEDVARLP